MTAKKQNQLPSDIYIRFVETLFRDWFTLAIGLSAQTFLAILVYIKTVDPAYLWVAAGLIVAGVLRLSNIFKYADAPPPANAEEARKRETDYILFGSFHGLMLGIFCFCGIYLAHDPFGELAALSVTLASATSIAGRNYGSPRMVMILIMTLTWPISLGFLLRLDFFHAVLGLFSIPFLIAIKRFADNVREVLLEAISERKKASVLADQFNRALNTMSHGLVMLDSGGKITVANAEAAHLLGISSPDAILGRSVHSLLMRAAAGGMIPQKDCKFIETQLTRALREGKDRKVLVRLSNGQSYEFSAREGNNELGVITFEDVTQRVESEEKIRTMARYDNLTGLANRAYFHEIVSEQVATGDPDRLCGLAVIDMDDFKSINDTLGHPVGDGLIYTVGEKLAAFASDRVKVSRFGGDEFLLFFDGIEDEQEFGRLMDQVFAALQGDVDVAGHALRIQVSAGAALSRAADADVDMMIVKADLALYKAKELGKNGWRLFEAAMDAAFRNRQVMKADLRAAIEAQSLRVVYQPIVSMKTMQIVSCEALSRWDHPDLGPISPAVFIPLAEEMGIISEISAFILKAACVECARWPAQTGVSVNLSAKDFRGGEVVQTVREALAESGLAPHRLEIEVTETALLDDKALSRQLIEELKAIGVRIALDDFGTGFSSLSYLHKLPLDKVKIDRSFLVDVTQNTRSLDLLKSVVELSRRLGLIVTVEGVETFEQLKVLSRDIKPDLAQGFLFGSALTASGIETMSNTSWPLVSPHKAARSRRAGTASLAGGVKVKKG